MHPGGSISAGGDDVRSGEPNADQPGRGNVFSGKDEEDQKLKPFQCDCDARVNKHVNVHLLKTLS